MLFALAAAFPVQPAVADQYDTLTASAGSSLKYDTNVFMSPDSIDPPPGFPEKSDYINVSFVELLVSKPYAQQRFQFDITKTTTRYHTFSYLDNHALDYRGIWFWALTPHLTGTLSADRTQAQIPFQDIRGNQRNVQTIRSRNFNFDGWVSGRLHLLSGVGQTESKTEQPILSQPSYRNYRVEAGIRYAAASGNSITLLQRWIPAELLDQPLDRINLIDTKYRDTESELKLIWKLSGNSRLEGSLNRKKRRNEHFTQRDFSGSGGEIRYTWTPTGKLEFNFAAGRDILPYVAFGNSIENSTYEVDRTLAFESIWQLDAKATVHFSVMDTLSDHRGPVFASTAPARKDNFRVAQFGVDWAFKRYLSLNSRLERGRRTSNVAGPEFSYTMATVGAVLKF